MKGSGFMDQVWWLRGASHLVSKPKNFARGKKLTAQGLGFRAEQVSGPEKSGISDERI